MPVGPIPLSALRLEGGRCPLNFSNVLGIHLHAAVQALPTLITRADFRYDKSDTNVFLYGSRPANHQETLSFQLAYIC